MVALDEEKKYIQIRFNRIANEYLKEGKQSGEKRIPKDSLRYYLEHSPEYMGIMKSVRFKEIESSSGYILETQNIVTGAKETKCTVTSAMVFDYDAVKECYDIDINISTITAYDEDPAEE